MFDQFDIIFFLLIAHDLDMMEIMFQSRFFQFSFLVQQITFCSNYEPILVFKRL